MLLRTGLIPRKPLLNKMKQEQKPGVGVDAFGSQAIDPTLNVKELVKLHKNWADELRLADEKLRDFQMMKLEELTKLEVAHLKEVTGLHVKYGKELDNEKTISSEAKAKVIESQLTIDRERANLSAQLLAKTVSDNNDKNDDRLKTLEAIVSLGAGKSKGIASTGDWGIRIVLAVLAIVGFVVAYFKT